MAAAGFPELRPANAGSSPIARLIHRGILGLLAAALHCATPRNILPVLAFIFCCGLAMRFGEIDGLGILSTAAPDVAVWLPAEIDAYLAAAAASLLAALALRPGTARDHVVAAAAPVRRRPIACDARPCRHRPAPANDDEDGGGLAHAR